MYSETFLFKVLVTIIICGSLGALHAIHDNEKGDK